MEKIKYRDLIMQYLTALEPDQTITTDGKKDSQCKYGPA